MSNVTELPTASIFSKIKNAAKDGKTTEQIIKEDLTEDEIAKIVRTTRIIKRTVTGVVILGAAAFTTKAVLDHFKIMKTDESETTDEI